jgi:hypothetical protein
LAFIIVVQLHVLTRGLLLTQLVAVPVGFGNRKIVALFRSGTTCPCKAHMEAQAAVASWRKAHMDMEAQAAVASWRAPRQALLLDRAAAVREICLRR